MLQCATWLLLLTTNVHSWAAENPLTASTDFSNEGYFVLNWDTGASDTSLVLEQASTSAFNDVFPREIAPAGALTITGLDDGEYYFRLTRNNSPVTEPIRVTVEHHSLARAGGFFLLGLVLFCLLVFIILNGNRRANI